MFGKGIRRSFFGLSVLVAAMAYGDSNIVVNPGFESGREGWFDRTCAIEIVTSPVHEGRHSGKAFQRLANWQGIKQSVFGRMIDGKTYQVSGWVRLDNAPSDEVAISFEQQDDSGTKYIGVARGIATDTAWTKLSGEFTLNVTGTLSVLDVYFEGPMPGVNFYVDDVVVYGPEANPPVIIPPTPQSQSQIDAKIRHQKIEGFGASGAYYTMNLVNHNKKSELYNLLFKELGLDIFRIRNTYDMEPQSMQETVEIIKNAKALRGDDFKVLMSSWSPPAYLKSNDNEVGGTLKKVAGKFVYDGFADWWYESLMAYAKAGATIDYISIQNELNYEAPWASCVFAPSESDDTTLAAHNIAYETVWQKLHSKMGKAMPKMLTPETSGLGDSEVYIKNLIDLSHVYGYAHHLYDCSGCGADPDRFIPRMISYREMVKKYGDKPIFQTEFEDDPGAWPDALNTALLLHNSLTVEQVSAYLYWDLFWAPGSGLVSLDDFDTYTIKPTYYAFKQYSAFIDANWQRVEAANDNTGLRISAYISPDNRKMTIVILNITQDMDIKLKLSIKNFAGDQGAIYRTSETENCVYLGKFNKRKPLELPANSITTLSLSAAGK
ncbi:MAG TPA: carbohydrate binding domain-containing protein [Candidatus Marinimicrobia bacterium]|nr:carbohydrate binding domain-containing protein [Candidatus Neomarinimicrobiota bacterium]HRS50960.1 carbohydrate binding domain-containing protein [Candidatus Neomarinimicrobiota bacterium]HRU91698.1 carbohydrate binding domain-containing protein [Candidatus Neomarinimicrobiota bacterium]